MRHVWPRYKASARFPLPEDEECDNRDEELLRFSRSFICKANGERVAAAVSPPGGRMGTEEEPATFAEVFPELMDVSESDTDFQQRSIGFQISLDASQAPASCEAMYWDPYLQTPLGAVQTAENLEIVADSSPPPALGGGSGGGDETENTGLIAGIAGGVGGAAVVAVVAALAWCKLWRPKPSGSKAAGGAAGEKQQEQQAV